MATSIFRENFPAVTALQQAADTAAFIIGLDLHKKTTAICVVDSHNPNIPVFQRKRLPNNELLVAICRFPGKKLIACEAAYGWFLLRDALADVPDVTFVPLDARKTSSWIASSGIKNDAIDAQVLCHVCLHGGIRSLAVHQPSHSARECYKLLKHREHLVRHRTKIKNQLQAFNRDYGPNPFTGVIPEKSVLASSMEADLLHALDVSSHRIDHAEKLMVEMSRNDPTVTLLQTIPGIGPITSFALRHKIDTIERFKDPAHLCAYFGFGVRERQSGDSVVKGKIAKTGDPLVRKLLIQGAQIVRSRCPECIPLFFPTLGQASLMKERKHANKVVTALARKNLTFVYFVWKNQREFDLEKYRERRLQSAISTAGAINTSLPVCPSSSAADLVSVLVR